MRGIHGGIKSPEDFIILEDKVTGELSLEKDTADINTAKRDNSNKATLSMALEFGSALDKLVMVMRQGATKYPNYSVVSPEDFLTRLGWEAECNASTITTGQSKTSQTNYVEAATINYSSSETQNTQSVNDRTPKNGLSETQREKLNPTEIGKEATKNESGQTEEGEPLTVSESPMIVSDSTAISAGSLVTEKGRILTSTMITILENFVGSSVVPAIKVWDYLETMNIVSGKPSNTYRIHRETVFVKDGVIHIGNKTGNWLLGGKPDSEYLDAAMRHMEKFVNEGFYDEDIGTAHLANAAWNLLAVMRLNYGTMEALDPDFDQAAFLEKYNDKA